MIPQALYDAVRAHIGERAEVRLDPVEDLPATWSPPGDRRYLRPAVAKGERGFVLRVERSVPAGYLHLDVAAEHIFSWVELRTNRAWKYVLDRTLDKLEAALCPT